MDARYAQQPRLHWGTDSAPVVQNRPSISSSPINSVRSDPQFMPSSDMSTIGQPIHLLTGPHINKTIRMELLEIQKAELGRKYAKVDRRPIDPPPVIQLKMYQVQENTTGGVIEVELDYDETQLFGLLCAIDLFQHPLQQPMPARGTASSPGISHHLFDVYDVMSGIDHPLLGSYSLPPAEGGPQWANAPHPSPHPITECYSKQTQALVGATVVQPTIVNYNGKNAIVFVFSDVAVRLQGTFLLRYRAFDIFSKQGDAGTTPAAAAGVRIAAEVYGGSFRVYSTKEFPGLAASTQLTKHLARWGVNVNIRETVRTRKRRASNVGSQGDTPPE